MHHIFVLTFQKHKIRAATAVSAEGVTSAGDTNDTVTPKSHAICFIWQKKKKLYEKTPACGAANRLYAQETAAHPLLSGVLVYGQHESLNKAKFLLMTMVQVGGRAEGMQCQMKCNVRLSLVLLLSQVDGAALLGPAVKEEGEITSHFGSLLLSNHWQGHTNVHTDTH